MNLNQLFVKHYEGYRAKVLTKSGKFVLSIVAGEGMYSSPRSKIDLSEESYTEVEIAIFNDAGEWATKEEASPVFPIIGEGEYSYFDEDSMPSCVFGYVPVEKLDDVFNAL